MDTALQAYLDAIPDQYRPLFDRLDQLILDAVPDAAVTISYGIPTYKVAKRRVYLGAYNDHVGLYGWQADRDGGFLERHGELRTGKGTIRLTIETAKKIPNKEFIALFRAALAP